MVTEPPQRRWVVLDVGETLVNETRIWSTWADVLEIPRLTLMAGLGAVIARDGAHTELFDLLGKGDWPMLRPRMQAAFGVLRTDDLYPDALRVESALRAAGYRVAIFANQPEQVSAELRALGFTPDAMAMSQEMGVGKPSPEFFARSLDLMGNPPPENVAYVGDRVDNDVLPSMAAGMRAVWIRRGPWGFIQQLPDGVRPALVVDTLDEFVERIEEVWA